MESGRLPVLVALLFITGVQICSGFNCHGTTGNFPMIESESCEVYWTCHDGRLVAEQCQGAHQFHYKERKCLHGSIVHCIQQRTNFKKAYGASRPVQPMMPPRKPKPVYPAMQPPPKPKPVYFPIAVNPLGQPPCAAPPCGYPVHKPVSCSRPPCGKYPRPHYPG